MLPTLPRNKVGTSELDSFRSSIAQPVVTPGERFAGDLAIGLAHHSGAGRLAMPYPVEDLHLLFYRQRDWRTPPWVNLVGSGKSPPSPQLHRNPT